MIKKIHNTEGIENIIENYKKLGAKFFSFINYVDNNWKT